MTVSNLKIGLEQVLLSEIVCYANIAIITKSVGDPRILPVGPPCLKRNKLNVRIRV